MRRLAAPPIPADAAAFRAAAVRDLKRDHLYWESPTGIEFLSRTLFRAQIPIPSAVPPGEYRAEVFLFRGGAVVSAQSSPLFVDKSGFERQVFNYAYQASFAYGFVTVLMALGFGYAGFVIFRPPLNDQLNAWMPVWARPRISAWMSCVPS